MGNCSDERHHIPEVVFKIEIHHVSGMYEQLRDRLDCETCVICGDEMNLEGLTLGMPQKVQLGWC